MADLEMRICRCGLDVERMISQISTRPSANPMATIDVCQGDQAADWIVTGLGASSNTGPSYISSFDLKTQLILFFTQGKCSCFLPVQRTSRGPKSDRRLIKLYWIYEEPE
jgi:hypothetical protein